MEMLSSSAATAPHTASSVAVDSPFRPSTRDKTNSSLSSALARTGSIRSVPNVKEGALNPSTAAVCLASSECSMLVRASPYVTKRSPRGVWVSLEEKVRDSTDPGWI